MRFDANLIGPSAEASVPKECHRAEDSRDSSNRFKTSRLTGLTRW